MNLLRVDGRPSKTTRSDEQYRAVESLEGMIPWNGRTDNLIDRFDGRALLDFYREPPPSSRRRPKTDDEAELDEVCRPSAFSQLTPQKIRLCHEQDRTSKHNRTTNYQSVLLDHKPKYKLTAVLTGSVDRRPTWHGILQPDLSLQRAKY